MAQLYGLVLCRSLRHTNDTPFRRKDCSETLLISDRVQLSSAEARVRVEGIRRGGLAELTEHAVNF